MAVFYNTDGKASYIIRYIFHKERKCGFMIESRCGIKCGSCTYKEQMGCAGCLYIQKPFWGESCPVKSCVEEKQLQHCGECGMFPCELAKAFAYDEKQGDGGKRLETCRCWKKEGMHFVFCFLVKCSPCWGTINSRKRF